MQSRRLVLVRHAQAAAALVDADRPLTERGVRDAAALGRWLASSGPAPDRVVASPARRALQTWDRAAGALADVPPRAVDERLYENTVESLLAVVRETPDDTSTLIVVGHNPSVGHLAHVLDDDPDDPAARTGLAGGFLPGTAAVFGIGVPFAEVGPGSGRLMHVWQPGDTPSGR